MRLIALCMLAILGSGCATASQKYVAFGPPGHPPEILALDRTECEGLATMYKGSDADAAFASGAVGAAAGVVGGAAYGALLGAVGSGLSAGSGSLIGLAVGGVFGLTIGLIHGVAENNRRYQSIYVACMTKRGYTLGG